LKNDINNIYKVVSFTNNRLYVVPLSVASTIVDKVEYTKLNKIELTDQKQNLIKLKVDRLGNISKAKY
jgi:CRISPR-associated endonuclease Csn1